MLARRLASSLRTRHTFRAIERWSRLTGNTSALPLLGWLCYGVAMLEPVLRDGQERVNWQPRWAPGQSGNPSGRPAGSKNRVRFTWRARLKQARRRYRVRRYGQADAERLALDDLALALLPVVRARVLRGLGAVEAGRGECRWCGRRLGADAVPAPLDRPVWAHAGCLPTLMLAVMAAARAEVLVKVKRRKR
jgi:hypothetical protein